MNHVWWFAADCTSHTTGSAPQVFWKDDSNWYSGTVIDFSDGKHLIHYDDGDKERVLLKNEKVRVLTVHKRSGSFHCVNECRVEQ